MDSTMKTVIVACLALAVPAVIVVAKPIDAEKTLWTSVATANDVKRLNNWRAAFEQARQEAIKAGYGDDVAKGGDLFKIDAAQTGSRLPEGYYKCSVSKLGGGFVQFIQYPAFRCHVTFEGGRRQFVKLSGSQRPVGYIYKKDSFQSVFLGTIVLGDEDKLVSYGQDEDRNEAGLVERIGAKRWRIIFPFPYYESTMDVIDLVPIK
jgi:Domain of unknown function (DUF4893)